MEGYVFTCLRAIKSYQDIYSSGIDTSKIIDLRKDLSIGDLCRFRVFLDSCILTMNKEMIDETYTRKCDFDGFLNHINNDSDNHGLMNPVQLRTKGNYFLEVDKVKNKINIPADNKIRIYYSLKNSPIDLTEQIKVIRNAFAHSQYSTFICDEGTQYLLGYIIDNAESDDETQVESGFVISDVIHRLILSYFSSNPNFGIPYRVAFINKRSVFSKELLEYYNQVSVKPSVSSQYSYDGFSNEHPMKNISLLLNNENILFEYIDDNSSEFEITEQPLENIITIEKIENICRQYSIPSTGIFESDSNMQDIVRLFSDTDNMVSNILTSVSYMNDVLISYSLKEINFETFSMAIEEIRNEDGGSIVSNRIGFALLYSWLIAHMLEYEKKCETAKNKTIIYRSKSGDNLDKLIDYSKLDTSCFDYDQQDYQNYIRSNAHNPFASKEYVMKRYRDALMHGQLKIEVNNSNQLVVAFYDIDKRRQRPKIVKVPIEELEQFIHDTINDSLSNVDSQVLTLDPDLL